MLPFVQAKLDAYQVEQVSCVLAVENGEGRVDPAALCELAQQARTDSVKGTGPGEGRMRNGCPAVIQRGNDSCDAPRHLGGRAPRKCQQKDAAWIDAGRNQATYAMRQRVRLPGAGAGDDQQRTGRFTIKTMPRGSALVGIQSAEQCVDPVEASTRHSGAAMVNDAFRLPLFTHPVTVNAYSTRD